MNVATNMAKDWFGGYRDREKENFSLYPRTTQFRGTVSLTF